MRNFKPDPLSAAPSPKFRHHELAIHECYWSCDKMLPLEQLILHRVKRALT